MIKKPQFPSSLHLAFQLFNFLDDSFRYQDKQISLSVVLRSFISATVFIVQAIRGFKFLFQMTLQVCAAQLFVCNNLVYLDNGYWNVPYNWIVVSRIPISFEMFDCKSIQIDESSSSDSESVENESSCSRKIYCPQLMVMDISSKSVYAECKKKMEKAEATLACNVSVASSVPLDGVSVSGFFCEFRIIKWLIWKKFCRKIALNPSTSNF